MGHIFISYSRQNAEYVARLIAWLEALGFDVWIDRDDLQQGTNWWESIVEAIRTCDACVPVLSPQARASKYVQREIALADNEGKRILPVLIAGDTKDWEVFVLTQIEDCRLPSAKPPYAHNPLPRESFHNSLANPPLIQHRANAFPPRTLSKGAASRLLEVFIGVLITVIGGLLLAFILGQWSPFPSPDTPTPQPTTIVAPTSTFVPITPTPTQSPSSTPTDDLPTYTPTLPSATPAPTSTPTINLRLTQTMLALQMTQSALQATQTAFALPMQTFTASNTRYVSPTHTNTDTPRPTTILTRTLTRTSSHRPPTQEAAAATPAAECEAVIIDSSASSLNIIYARPVAQLQPTDRIAPNAAVIVTNRQVVNGRIWYAIQYGIDQRTGWVWSDYLTSFSGGCP